MTKMNGKTIEIMDRAIKRALHQAFKEGYVSAKSPIDKVSLQKVMVRAAELYNESVRPKEKTTADFIIEWCVWQTSVDVYVRLEAAKKVPLTKK